MFQHPSNSNNPSGLFDNHLYTLNEDRFSFENSNMNFMYGQPFYKPHVPSYHLPHITNTNLNNSLNSSLKESAQYNDTIYGTNVQNLYSSTHMNSVMRHDQTLYRKHGTSFEHEQPVPYSSNDYSGGDLKSGSKISSKEDGRNNGQNFQEMTVTLQRQESGFGFRIIGGTEEGSQVSKI